MYLITGSDINGMKCQQHRHSSLYPSDTEDEEDDKERYLYCHSHHHDTHLPGNIESILLFSSIRYVEPSLCIQIIPTHVS